MFNIFENQFLRSLTWDSANPVSESAKIDPRNPQDLWTGNFCSKASPEAVEGKTQFHENQFFHTLR